MAKKLSTYQKILEKQENLKMAKNKLPSSVKQLRGTYRKSREVKNEPLTRGIPRKPSNMTPGGSRFWDMIIDRLIKIGSIDICDDLSLSILSESLSEYFELTHFLNKNGRVYEFKNHKNEISLRTRPECKILSDCWSRIYPLLKEYGLTFKSRADITPNPLKQTESVW